MRSARTSAGGTHAATPRRRTSRDEATGARTIAPFVAAILAGALMPIMDTTIVAIGMQAIITAFAAAVSVAQWVTTAYLLALAVMIPVSGWLQRRLGGWTLWLGGLIVFTAGSLLCALSPTIQVLIAARAVQGFGAGVLMTLLQTMPMQQARRAGVPLSGRLMGIISLPVAVGPIVAPVLGGMLLGVASWHWLFLINLPVGLAALAMAWRWVRPEDGRERDAPLDVAGLLLVGLGLVGVLVGTTNVAEAGGMGHADVLVPLVGGTVLLVAFAWWEARMRHPLVEVALLRGHVLAASVVAVFALGAAMYAGQFLLPLFWQGVRGTSVLDAALLLIPQGVGSLLARPAAGALTDRLGSRVVAAGAFTAVAVTTAPFAIWPASAGTAALLVVLFMRGVALGMLFIPVMTASYTGLAEPAIPDATMLTRLSQQMGAAVGTALAAVVLEAAATSTGDQAAAFGRAFWAAVALALVGAAVSLRLPAQGPAEIEGSTPGADVHARS